MYMRMLFDVYTKYTNVKQARHTCNMYNNGIYLYIITLNLRLYPKYQTNNN